MIYLLIAIGSGTLGFLACAILTVGKQSDPPEYDEAISQWRKRAIKAEGKLKDTQKRLEALQIEMICDTVPTGNQTKEKAFQSKTETRNSLKE
jgi:hypothetical protein